ncbi:hypothetical protein O181_029786 [Austropuccinia psidii MF-1]|uniref:Ras GEF n=1 Tax=Austropuccinia psidii MF-1 TaxID=1389203 RepID=A0A9Q3CX67_9BASI|nr:hypothetical protein [Austropuccinia psidii MF-1]
MTTNNLKANETPILTSTSIHPSAISTSNSVNDNLKPALISIFSSNPSSSKVNATKNQAILPILPDELIQALSLSNDRDLDNDHHHHHSLNFNLSSSSKSKTNLVQSTSHQKTSSCSSNLSNSSSTFIIPSQSNPVPHLNHSSSHHQSQTNNEQNDQANHPQSDNSISFPPLNSNHSNQSLPITPINPLFINNNNLNHQNQIKHQSFSLPSQIQSNQNSIESSIINSSNSFHNQSSLEILSNNSVQDHLKKTPSNLNSTQSDSLDPSLNLNIIESTSSSSLNLSHSKPFQSSSNQSPTRKSNHQLNNNLSPSNTSFAHLELNRLTFGVKNLFNRNNSANLKLNSADSKPSANQFNLINPLTTPNSLIKPSIISTSSSSNQNQNQPQDFTDFQPSKLLSSPLGSPPPSSLTLPTLSHNLSSQFNLNHLSNLSLNPISSSSSKTHSNSSNLVSNVKLPLNDSSNLSSNSSSNLTYQPSRHSQDSPSNQLPQSSQTQKVKETIWNKLGFSHHSHSIGQNSNIKKNQIKQALASSQIQSSGSDLIPNHQLDLGPSNNQTLISNSRNRSSFSLDHYLNHHSNPQQKKFSIPRRSNHHSTRHHLVKQSGHSQFKNRSKFINTDLVTGILSNKPSISLVRSSELHSSHSSKSFQSSLTKHQTLTDNFDKSLLKSHSASTSSLNHLAHASIISSKQSLKSTPESQIVKSFVPLDLPELNKDGLGEDYEDSPWTQKETFTHQLKSDHLSDHHLSSDDELENDFENEDDHEEMFHSEENLNHYDKIKLHVKEAHNFQTNHPIQNFDTNLDFLSKGNLHSHPLNSTTISSTGHFNRSKSSPEPSLVNPSLSLLNNFDCLPSSYLSHTPIQSTQATITPKTHLNVTLKSSKAPIQSQIISPHVSLEHDLLFEPPITEPISSSSILHHPANIDLSSIISEEPLNLDSKLSHNGSRNRSFSDTLVRRSTALTKDREFTQEAQFLLTPNESKSSKGLILSESLMESQILNLNDLKNTSSASCIDVHKDSDCFIDNPQTAAALSVKADYVIGVIGPSGVGKSTIIFKALRKPLESTSVDLYLDKGQQKITSYVAHVTNGMAGHTKLVQVLEIDQAILSKQLFNNNKEGLSWPERLPQLDGALLCYDAMDPNALDKLRPLLHSFWTRGGISLIVLACKSNKDEKKNATSPLKAAELVNVYGTGMIQLDGGLEDSGKKMRNSFNWIMKAIKEANGDHQSYSSGSTRILSSHGDENYSQPSRSSSVVATTMQVQTDFSQDRTINQNHSRASSAHLLGRAIKTGSTSYTSSSFFGDSQNSPHLGAIEALSQAFEQEASDKHLPSKATHLKSDLTEISSHSPPNPSQIEGYAPIRPTPTLDPPAKEQQISLSTNKPMSLSQKYAAQKAMLINQRGGDMDLHFEKEVIINKFIYAIVSGNEPGFVDQFLIVFRRFSAPFDVLNALIARFEFVSDHLESDPLLTRYAHMKICHSLMTWVETYPSDFVKPTTLKILKAFTTLMLSTVWLLHYGVEILPMTKAIPNMTDEDSGWALPDITDQSLVEKSLESLSRLQSISIQVPGNQKSNDLVHVQSSPIAPHTTHGSKQESEILESKPILNESASPITNLDSSKASQNAHSIDGKSIDNPQSTIESCANEMTRRPLTSSSHLEPRNELKLLHDYANQLLNIPEELIALQITRLEWNIFSEMKPRHLIRYVMAPRDPQNPKKALRDPNSPIARSTDFLNHLAVWASSMILIQDKLKSRARMLLKLMKVAYELRDMDDFHSLMGVLAGIEAQPVYRLEATFDVVQQMNLQAYRRYLSLKKLMSSQRSFSAYRLARQTASSQCVPYLGTYLQDITAIDEVKDDMKDGKVNLTKFLQISKAAGTVLQCERLAPDILIDERIESLILRVPVLSEDVQYELSYKYKPRLQASSNALTENGNTASGKNNRHDLESTSASNNPTTLSNSRPNGNHQGAKKGTRKLKQLLTTAIY